MRAEVGDRIGRYREFVQFDDDRIFVYWVN